MAMRAFEDFSEGESFALGEVTLTREEILAFAQEYDPHPFHLVDASPVPEFSPRLFASGWQSCLLFMRLLVDGVLNGSTCAGSPIVERVTWRKPVCAGDRLTAATTVREKGPWPARPSLGRVRFTHTLHDASGALVLEMDNTILFARREAA